MSLFHKIATWGLRAGLAWAVLEIAFIAQDELSVILAQREAVATADTRRGRIETSIARKGEQAERIRARLAGVRRGAAGGIDTASDRGIADLRELLITAGAYEVRMAPLESVGSSTPGVAVSAKEGKPAVAAVRTEVRWRERVDAAGMALAALMARDPELSVEVLALEREGADAVATKAILIKSDLNAASQ